VLVRASKSLHCFQAPANETTSACRTAPSIASSPQALCCAPFSQCIEDCEERFEEAQVEELLSLVQQYLGA